MAVNGTIKQTTFTDTAEISSNSPLKIKTVHVEELRTAITALQSYAANVDNCGNCTYCQNCETCQACQACQFKFCQSKTFQGCQSYNIYCELQCKSGKGSNGYDCWQCDQCSKSYGDCDCSDDGG